ncbi:MAG: YitT family protein [Cellulosilyticaceae bacterium]
MKTVVKEYIKIIIGALFIAVGLYFFWAPSQLAAGGISGLSIVIKSMLPMIPMGLITLMLDVIMFTIGFIVLGKSFGVRSIVCSLSVSGCILILEYFVPNAKPLSSDTLIVLAFGAIFIAIGQAIVFNLEASSGGTDIIAKIISTYTHLNIGVALIIADMAVVILAITVFGIEKGLYAALGVIVVSSLIDYFISGLSVEKYIMIIPSKMEVVEPINQYILETLGRGATIYKAEGAYSKEHKTVITSVLDNKEFIDLKRYIVSIDEKAFVTVQNLHEVVGEGFKGKV